LGIAHRHRLLETVLDRDLHPDRDRADVVEDIAEVRAHHVGLMVILQPIALRRLRRSSKGTFAVRGISWDFTAETQRARRRRGDNCRYSLDLWICVRRSSKLQPPGSKESKIQREKLQTIPRR